MYNQEFYDHNAEEFLGGRCTYRVAVADLSVAYDIDRYDLAQYGDKWFVLRANGCSCWGGEWGVEFAGDTLDEVREYITREYGTQLTDYYKGFMEDWSYALAKAEMHW